MSALLRAAVVGLLGPEMFDPTTASICLEPVLPTPKADLQVSSKQPDGRTNYFPVLHLRSSLSQLPTLGQFRSYDRSESFRADDRFQPTPPQAAVKRSVNPSSHQTSLFKTVSET